jgi:serine/threonine protein kinase
MCVRVATSTVCALPATTLVPASSCHSCLGCPAGSSSVLLATDRSTGQEWACKVMALPRAASELRAERQGRDRVLREISAMLDLEHPCVIGLREYFVQDQKAYLLMELSRGGTWVGRGILCYCPSLA